MYNCNFRISIYGCAQTSEDAFTTETENVESQDTAAESEDASAEGELDKTVALEEHDEGEDETDQMLDDTEQDIFTYIIDDNRAVITGLQAEYESFLQENCGEIEIPDTLGGYSVVEIGDHAFENIKLNSVQIPESVEVIGNSAFRNTGVENVNLSQCHDLKEVKANAFENCNLQGQDYS
ncbi:MAG: leucine-rich repeat domain-containing protein, partial [Lachnospiraceae bacterium]|nr:leucine-rich repeat domain-containing protein [Lachnospiraceae bacterium]